VIPQKRFIIVEVTMKNISLALICFSALSFALAVFVAFQGPFLEYLLKDSQEVVQTWP